MEGVKRLAIISALALYISSRRRPRVARGTPRALAGAWRVAAKLDAVMFDHA